VAVVLEVPFGYDTNIIPVKCRNPRVVPVIGSLAVELAELSSDQAPVLATLFQTDALGKVDVKRDPITYRCINGRLARSYTAGMVLPTPIFLQENAHKILRGAGRTTEDIGKWEQVLQENEDQSILDLATGEGVSGKLERFIEAKVYFGDDRDDRATAAREALQQGAAFIDGVLHVPSTGPGIAVATSYEGGIPRPSVSAFAEWKQRDKAGWRYQEPKRTGRAQRRRRRAIHTGVVCTLPAHEMPWLQELAMAGRLLQPGGDGFEPFEFVCENLSIVSPDALRQAAAATCSVAAHDFRLRLDGRELMKIVEPFVGKLLPFDIEHYAAMKQLLCIGNADMKVLRHRVHSVAMSAVQSGIQGLSDALLAYAEDVANNETDALKAGEAFRAE
jgi:hypothetical protein